MNDKKIVELDLNDILPNRFQPRIKFSESSITELAESIREHGVIQPIVVRPLGDRYEIIAGERRYKASVLAGKETIPAIITELNDKDSAEVALIENVQRQDLTPIEEAISYKKILDMGYLTQEELATKLGKTQSTIANKLRLLNLDDEIQEALLESKISERHARSLLKLSDKEKQKQMLQRIIAERLTVRRTDEEINKMMNENNNIEVLDFDENPSQPLTNNFNIPTTPIVEDIVPEPTMPSNTPTTINPGFMDVNKIEQEAKDIHVDKPMANLDNLLKPADILNPGTVPVSNLPVEEEDTEPAETVLKPGKFFNLADLEETTDSVSNTQMEIPKTETPVQAPQNSVNSIFETNNFVTQFDTQATEVPLEKPKPIIPVNPEPLVQTPLVETPSSIAVPSYSDIDAELYKNPEPMMTSNAMNANNMKMALDVIRECAKKIEGLGFKLEMEEYDFEDMYQTIFKIDKK